jgi:hypothetical protein
MTATKHHDSRIHLNLSTSVIDRSIFVQFVAEAIVYQYISPLP